jgi:hypothetical protein
MAWWLGRQAAAYTTLLPPPPPYPAATTFPLLLPPRSERLAKYNQLLRIEEELGEAAVYAGDKWRHIAIE